VQYASADYVARLNRIGARLSMAAVGNPYENAIPESFFRTLKCEEVDVQEYRTFEEAEAHRGPYFSAVYNAKRLHLCFGYRPPVEFEAALLCDAPLGDLT
jgi:transposase InsO family protein